MVDLRGRGTVQEWQALARAGRWREVFSALIERHYDPLYLLSMQRNYRGTAAALSCPLEDGSAAALARAAAHLKRSPIATAARNEPLVL